jgi:anti-sigma regulatory factor (Ser/Thr protein kinase)
VLTEGAARRRAPSGFIHEALLYDDDLTFLKGTAEFVRTGVAAGEAVLVAIPGDGIAALRDELGDIADQVGWVDITVTGRNPARIIPLWHDLLDENAGRPVRGLSQVVYAERRPAELAEALLHEALLNLAFERADRFRLRCPYDVRSTGIDILDDLGRTHQQLLNGMPHESTVFDPVRFATGTFAAPLPRPPASAERRPVSLAELRALREMVREAALRHGLDRDRADDLALAAHEICKNSRRFAGGGTLAVWTEGDTLLCEASDTGRITELMVGLRLPDPMADGGRGLWLANQLCDLVQIRSSQRGTTVRLHVVR